ncbi:MAG: UDP binding domain-containing protein [Phycisphaerales bacterium]
MYRTAIKQVIPVSSGEVAESPRCLENVYRLREHRPGQRDEGHPCLEKMGIDVSEVIETYRRHQALRLPGPFYPGPGLGRAPHIPHRPVLHLTWKALRVQADHPFHRAGRPRQPRHAQLRRAALPAGSNDAGKSVKGSKVLVMGLAYKPDVDDVRESPSFELIEHLADLGAHIDYHDPHVPATHRMRRHDLKMHSVDLTPQTVAGYDCV